MKMFPDKSVENINNQLLANYLVIANNYMWQSNFAQAEKIYARIIQIQEKMFGVENQNIAESYNNLAALYESQGRYEESELFFKKALTANKKLLGQDHPKNLEKGLTFQTKDLANPSFVAKKYKFEKGKIWLGRIPYNPTKKFGGMLKPLLGFSRNRIVNEKTPIGYQSGSNICLVSSTGGGKGASFLINNLLLYPGSVVVIDPKGENAAITSARRRSIGQTVHVLDPFNLPQIPNEYKSSFNPLDTLDPNDPKTINEVNYIVDALVIDFSDKDKFWNEAARQFIRGLILHVLTAKKFEGQRNLITVRNLIVKDDWAEMAENTAFDGFIINVAENFRNMEKESIRTFEGVRYTAIQQTQFIDSPGIKECLSESKFQLSELKNKPEGMSLYLSFPPEYISMHNRWLRMMLALITNEMTKIVEKPATGHSVLVCLDEFTGLERMKFIEEGFVTMRKYGVTFLIILQTLMQLKAVYGENWETFLHNSSLNIFFNLNDMFSVEYISKITEISPYEIREKISKIINPKDSNYPGLALVLIKDEKPILLRRVNYFEDNFFSKLIN